MKIISDGWSGEGDITIIEDLEPTGAYYSIEQGDVKIILGNKARTEEIIKALNFLITE